MSVFSRTAIRRLATTLRPKTNLETDFEIQIQNIRKEFQSLGAGSVDLTTDDVTGVAVVTFNNRERKNSISGKMMAQMWEVMHALQHWPKGKALVIRGGDNFFCSGGDLNTVRRIADPENGRKMSLLMHDNCTRLQSLPLISCALLEGMALGGGAEIATASDFRVMAKTASFGFVHIRIGIVSAWGGGSRLAQLIGQRAALDLMLTGRQVGAEEAIKLGLADWLLEGEGKETTEVTIDWLKKYTERSVATIRAVKRIINGTRYLGLEDSLEEEVNHSTSVWGGVDHHKGLLDNIKHKK